MVAPVAAPPTDTADPEPTAPPGGADAVSAAQRKLEAMIAALESGRGAGAAPPVPADRPAPAAARLADGPLYGAEDLADDPFAAADAALAADGFAGALPADPPVSLERAPAAADPSDETRGRLAAMFGLSVEELAARTAAREAEAAEEAVSEEAVAEEPFAEGGEELVDEDTGEIAGEVAVAAVCDRVEAAADEPDPADPEPAATAAPEPEPVAAAEKPAGPVGGVVAEEVSDYMEALLARMREGRPEREPDPAAKPKAAPAKPAAPKAEPRTDLGQAADPAAGDPAAAAELPPPAAMPRTKIDKDQLREEMRQLRAIANSSARSAVMESTWKRTRARLVMEVLMCTVALGLGLTLILTSVWGVAVHWVSGGAVCSAAVWIARDFGRSLETLRKQKAAAAKAARDEAARTGAPPKGGPKALDVPAPAGTGA